MVISHNSQLGLRFNDIDIQVKFLELLITVNKDLADGYMRVSELAKKEGVMTDEGKFTIEIPNDLKQFIPLDENNNIIPDAIGDYRETRNIVNAIIDTQNIIDKDGSSYFFICESVYKAANLIKVSAWFTGRTLKDIKIGKYTYLMGKNEMVRFYVGIGAIKGFYYDDKNKIAFEWGIEMENGNYYYDGYYDKLFTKIMQVLTFVELGDIEIQELPAGRNNNAPKKEGKITNTSPNTVFVVDSSWNKLIIRTDGFAVKGHFRLQPCGFNHADRILIWIDAFEKHGYKRQPKAKIIHD